MSRFSVKGRAADAMRLRVLDEEGGICHLCGHPGATTMDHIVPVSRGGARLDRDNLRAAHRKCNSERGAGPVVRRSRTSRIW